MRNIEEYTEIKRLFESGFSKRKISKITQIPRRTITDWINKGFQPLTKSFKFKEFKPERFIENNEKDYAFLFGFYLGDGHINKCARTYRLRMFNDNKYKNLNRDIELSMKRLFKNNSPNHMNSNCCIIYVCNSNLPILFPQHGAGEKNSRKIEIHEWQKPILKKYAKDFVRGLFLSDGFKGTSGKYRYYSFSNTSFDISNILKTYLDFLNIRFTERFITPKNPSHKRISIISVRRQEEVKKLEEFIEEKS